MGFFTKHKEDRSDAKRASDAGKSASSSASDPSTDAGKVKAKSPVHELGAESDKTKEASKETSKETSNHVPTQGDQTTGGAEIVGVDTALEDPEVDQVDSKKVYTKEKAPVNDGFEVQMGESEAETETFINTKLNALLYHTSDDSIDRYKSENTQSDFLGRLFYDDYDPANRSAVASFSSLVPLSSPLRSGIVSPAETIEKTMFEVGDSPHDAPEKTDKSVKPVRPSFASQVSFDTLCDSHHQAITLKAKHPEFKFRRNNKCFLIGFNNDSESFKAVEWAFLEMVVHGDTIIVLHVLDSKMHRGLDRAVADATFEKIKSLNTHRRKISIVFESVIGQPQKLLKQAIAEYKPAMMIVGTSHYGQNSASSSVNNSSTNLQSSRLHMPFFSKVSISKYFLQFALVPVILVKPFYEIHEQLERPVDGEEYFSHWLAGIDVSHTYEKKKKFLSMRSPTGSRNSSHTSLVDLEAQSRGRSDLFPMGSRDSSTSRSQSRSARSEGRSLSRGKDRLAEDERARSRSRSRLSRIFNN